MNSSLGILDRLFIKTGFKKPPVQKERRRSKRFRVELPVQFRVFLRSRPEITTCYHPARLFDISEHGVGMLVQTVRFDGLNITRLDAKTSEECLLEIRIPFDPEPLALKGRMIWYIQTPEYDPFVMRVGVSLQDMDPDRQRKLRAFIGICVHANEIDA
jgi:hypothetical protein